MLTPIKNIFYESLLNTDSICDHDVAQLIVYLKTRSHETPFVGARAQIWAPCQDMGTSSKGSIRAPCRRMGTNLNMFAQYPLYLLSHNLLKHQLQICLQFLDGYKHLLITALSCLKNVHFSAQATHPGTVTVPL